jgi:selenocysteine lyase/cysteine desulfurase
MGLIEAAGPAAIGEWHRILAAHLLAGARSRGLSIHGIDDPRRKTVSTAIIVRDANAVEAALRVHGVIASARGTVIRLAPHYYSTPEDIDRALDALVDVVQAR